MDRRRHPPTYPPGIILTNSFAWGINEWGQVVGYSWNDVPFEAHAFLWDKGALSDLGSLGGYFTEAVEINDRGQVVGIAVSGGNSHAFLWQRGTMTDLGAMDFQLFPGVFLNEQGQVAVNYASGPPSYGTGERAFLWERGARTELGTLGGDFTGATAMNDRGQIVGISTTAAGEFHAFVWDKGTMTDLGGLGAPGAPTPVYINERGQVVSSYSTGNAASETILWDCGDAADDSDKELRDRSCSHDLRPSRRALPGLGGSFSYPAAINERGQVAGGSAPPNSPYTHAVLWEHGRVEDLVSTSVLDNSYAVAINEDGQVLIAGSQSQPGQPYYWGGGFLWERGVLTDLGTLGGLHGLYGDEALIIVSALNERGQVIGGSLVPSGARHAFLWKDGVMTDLVAAAATASATIAGVPGASDGRANAEAGGAAPIESSGSPPSEIFDLALAPNPTHGEVALSFRAPIGSSWQVEVLDLVGHRVRDIKSGAGNGGLRTLHWDGRDRTGSLVRPGVYWARLTADGRQFARRVVVLGAR